MYIDKSKKIIIKIGSSILIDKKGKPRKKWLQGFAEDINYLIKRKKKVIIVSSGAIALGVEYLKIKKKSLKLDQSQAVASIGQIELMNFYKNIFNKNDIKISQILLTLEDTEQRRRAINARRTIDNLLSMNIVPIVNENDTTATTEIKYGDNDRLASRVAQIISSDCLILLSDVDGFYMYDKKSKRVKIIRAIKNINKEIEQFANKTSNNYGSGGMKTKIEAAKICQLSGCHMVIANGNKINPIKNLIYSKKCTWFIPKISKLDARKKWIIGSVSPKGQIIIDDGALKAISNGKSLLPAGIIKIMGLFKKGDHVIIKDNNGKEYGRGLSSFTSNEINQIKGLHSSKIKNILGYPCKDEVIHKDDLVKF